MTGYWFNYGQIAHALIPCGGTGCDSGRVTDRGPNNHQRQYTMVIKDGPKWLWVSSPLINHCIPYCFCWRTCPPLLMVKKGAHSHRMIDGYNLGDTFEDPPSTIGQCATPNR